MPVPAIARQPRRLNAEDSAHLPIAERAQQAFKTGAVCSRSGNPQIVVDHIDVSPAQRACTIDKGILAPLAFKIVLHLTRCGLTDVHTSPPAQMISGDFVHGRPPRGSSRSEEHTSELQSPCNLVCLLLLEKQMCSQRLHTPLTRALARRGPTRPAPAH